jgi:hypothetical protein
MRLSVIFRALLCLLFKRLTFVLDLVLGLPDLRVNDILLALGKLPRGVVLDLELAGR